MLPANLFTKLKKMKYRLLLLSVSISWTVIITQSIRKGLIEIPDIPWLLIFQALGPTLVLAFALWWTLIIFASAMTEWKFRKKR